MGVQGAFPLPEREVSSHFALLQGGPAARQKKYEWMSGLKGTLNKIP